MHYEINNSVISSEYAAKSVRQPNKIVIDFITSLPNNISVLDYGCGKLRYTIPLASIVKEVVAVDSYEQLNRLQIIGEYETTIIKYITNHFDNVKAYDMESQLWRQHKYDLILCTNVLSAVPDDNVRLNILRNIKRTLNNDGFAFVCVQYRNSYFSKYDQRKDITKYNDGWIIKYGNKNAFYGIIPPDKLHELCHKADLNVMEMKIKDGSVFFKLR